MFQNSIDNKPFFEKNTSTGTVLIRDLTQSMFDLTNVNHVDYSLFKCSASFVMRPDLVSQSCFSNTSFAEIILKYNSISNPFTINKDDILLVPTLDSVQANIQQNQTIDSDGGQSIRNAYKYIDPTKNPTPSSTVQAFDSRQIVATANNAGTSNTILPPNISQPGVTQVTYKNGRVYFGSSNANIANNCIQNGATSSEFLKTVINNNKI